MASQPVGGGRLGENKSDNPNLLRKKNNPFQVFDFPQKEVQR